MITVSIEVDIPANNASVDALMSQRDFRAGLHPLAAPRDFPLHLRSLSHRTVHDLTGAAPVNRPATLSFGINGGPLQTVPVRLPASGVYPWVLMTGCGDEANLISATKLPQE